jgi:probable HAF family extracellular repeat protein
VTSTNIKLIASLILSAAAMPALAAEAPHYSMDYVGAFFAEAMNNAGDIAGTARTGIYGEINSTMLYSGGTLPNLQTGTDYSSVAGINDKQQVLFSSGNNTFIYSGGKFNALPLANASASGINNAGQVVGSRANGGSSVAFIYSDGKVTDLPRIRPGTNYGSAINNLGQVAGSTLDNNNIEVPFIYADGQFTNLRTTLPITNNPVIHALDINDNGQVLLQMDDFRKPSSYIYSNGVSTDLGHLDSSGTFAVAMNNNGIVVGTTGLRGNFLWQEGQMYDLNTLVTMPGWKLSSVIDINDSNQIAAFGCRTSGSYECGTMLLSVTAVPEASTYAMMLGGLGMLGFVARRRRAGQSSVKG